MEDCRLVLSRFLFATMPRTIPATHAATDGDVIRSGLWQKRGNHG